MFSKRDHMTRLAPTLDFYYFRDETKPNLTCDDDEFANTFIFYFSPVHSSNMVNSRIRLFFIFDQFMVQMQAMYASIFDVLHLIHERNR